MTLMEPYMVATLAAYVLTPFAAFGLGIDPVFAVDHVALYGVAPLFVGLLLMLAGVFLTTGLCENVVGRPAVAASLGTLALASVLVVVAVWQFVHRPEGWLEIAALVVTSPFIAITAVMAVVLAAAFALLPFRGLIALRAMRRANSMK